MSKYFPVVEYTCKCGCGFSALNLDLLYRLDLIREVLGRPLVLDSGCRCEKRNRDQGGEENSDHLRGNAVDARAINSHTRFVIIDEALRLGIKRIGIAEKFLHLSVDLINPQGVIFLYPSPK